MPNLPPMIPTTGERIISRQDSARSLELLAAASTFYTRGKRTLAGQMALTIGMAVLLSFLAIHFPDFKVAATFISVTVVWLDVLFIDRIQAQFRKCGAKAQESFDCELFDLPWNDLRAGEKLEPEAIQQAAVAFTAKRTDTKLRGWYPASVEVLPLPLARLLCQRACFWWETTQRRQYGRALLVAVVAALVLIGGWGVYRALSFGELILSVYAPLAPAIIWCIREFWRQSDAADALVKGRGFVDKIWIRAISGDLDAEQLARVSRQIQDSLFDSRSRNPLIFNWIYERLRSANEIAMNEAATRMGEDALSKVDAWRGILQSPSA